MQLEWYIVCWETQSLEKPSNITGFCKGWCTEKKLGVSLSLCKLHTAMGIARELSLVTECQKKARTACSEVLDQKNYYID